jgi:alpha-mannosidase
MIKHFKIVLTIIILFIFGYVTPIWAFIEKENKSDSSTKDIIHVIGHAHMDMNWLWPYSETMKMAIDNLRQAVAFMEEYPDYKISRYVICSNI